MPFRHSFRGLVRRCRPYGYLSASALLLVTLGCGENDSPTAPTAASTPEATSTPEAAPEFAVASNSWMSRRDMPLERYGPAMATVPNSSGQSILYVIGGASAAGGSLSRVQAYNVATNTWSYKASLPGPLKRLNGAAVIGGKIYVPGGQITNNSESGKLYVYDPKVNTWTTKQMPEAGFGGVTGVIQNKLYVVMNCPDLDHCGFPQRWLLRYDPATDKWEYLPTPPENVGGVGGAIGNKLYVATTWPPSDQSVLNVYDPATNMWTKKTTNMAVRSGAASTVVGAKLYMIGGGGTRTTSVYSPSTNQWTNRAQVPSVRSGAAAARVFLNGIARIELVGGSLPGNNLQYTP